MFLGFGDIRGLGFRGSGWAAGFRVSGFRVYRRLWIFGLSAEGVEGLGV